jgi:secreted trypsin-like serine protease
MQTESEHRRNNGFLRGKASALFRSSKFYLFSIACLFGCCSAEWAFANQSLRAPRPLIVGGTPANIQDYPWVASLQIQDGPDSFQCGGSVIGKNWVLTAAHCLTNDAGVLNPALVVKIYTGSSTVFSGTEHAVDQILVHENYRASTHENDIALLRSRDNINVTPVYIDDGYQQMLPGYPMTVLGWGRTSATGPTSTILLKADVPLITNGTCNSSASYAGRITDAMMCAGRQAGGVDFCWGDSGGPVLVGNSQDGIVSWSTGCAERDKYGVYTRVAYYADWIRGHSIGGTGPNMDSNNFPSGPTGSPGIDSPDQ